MFDCGANHVACFMMGAMKILRIKFVNKCVCASLQFNKFTLKSPIIASLCRKTQGTSLNIELSSFVKLSPVPERGL